MDCGDERCIVTPQKNIFLLKLGFASLVVKPLVVETFKNFINAFFLVKIIGQSKRLSFKNVLYWNKIRGTWMTSHTF